MNNELAQTKKVGKESFDKTPFTPILIKEKGIFKVMLGEFTRLLHADDLEGLNICIRARVSQLGSIEAAESYRDAIINGAWQSKPPTPSDKISPWVVELRKFCEALGLIVEPYILSDTPSDGDRLRHWEIKNTESGTINKRNKDALLSYIDKSELAVVCNTYTTKVMDDDEIDVLASIVVRTATKRRIP